MAEDTMSKVKVTKQCLVVPPPGVVTLLYPKGFEGTAPNSHIDIIVAAKAGDRVTNAPPQKVAENQDAFKSGSDNVSIG